MSHKKLRSLVSLRLIDADSAVQPSQPMLWRSRLVAKKATKAKSAIAEQGHLWMETSYQAYSKLGLSGKSNMVPFWDLLGHINDLTSNKIPLTAL